MKSLRALIIDDSSVMRKIVERSLRQAGLDLSEVKEAGNGAEALALLANTTVDLILCDINMPVMDGVQAILRIRMTRPDAKFICMTGNPEAGCPEGLVLLNKPFSAEKLLLSVNELLRPSVSTP